MLAASTAIHADPHPPRPYPTNDNPASHIRFRTASEAEAHRERLIRFIWPGGLPTNTMPSVSVNVGFNPDLAVIVPSRVSRVDRLVADVNGLESIAYLLTPTNAAHANRLVIVHQGHAGPPADTLGYGVGDTANALLAAGYSVVTVEMPLCGWNADVTAVVGGRNVTIPNRGSTGHDDMFNATYLPALGGAGEVLRLFLEPTVQAVNHFQHARPDMKDATMIGLSGGGWTTAMVAAIDTRITLSIPVAGCARSTSRTASDRSPTWSRYSRPCSAKATPRTPPTASPPTWNTSSSPPAALGAGRSW